jgi:putative transposase
MKRITRKRKLVKGNGKFKVPDGLAEELLAVEDGLVFGQVRGELFRLFQMLLEKIMELELSTLLGYAPYQKNGNKSNSRNGYRIRKGIVMKEGVMSNIKIPRDRNGEYQTAVLPRLKRYEPDLLEYVQELYLNSNSTRPLSKMLTNLFDWPMSHGQVSRFCQHLDVEVKQWLKRPIEDKYVGLFLDAVWLPLRRYRQQSEKECMLLVLGVRADGVKEVVGMRLVAEESAEAWSDLLAELKSRGLKGKKLVIAVIDGLTGFKNAVLRTFPNLAIQRCTVHKERNVLHYVPYYNKEAIAEELKVIYAASCPEDAIARKDAFCLKWRKTFPSAVRCLAADFEDTITFLQIKNYQLRKLFYTNNPIERINKEIKRRVRVMEMLPAEESAYRIAYWVIQNLEKGWRTYKVRGYAVLPNLRKAFTH